MDIEAELSSGDLSRATGCTPRAIRFYEEQGLLRPRVVSGGGHRRYSGEDLERLRLISDLRELGLSLQEIRTALELRAGCETGSQFAARFQEILLGHIRQAEQRLSRLRRVKRELEAALGAVQLRLRCQEEACPCEEAPAVEGPRVVRVLGKGICEVVPGRALAPAAGTSKGDAAS